MTMTITIHPYNPFWTQEFETIRQSLQEILGGLALRIDHIGSTSVPGLGAKDVIDVQITVQALTLEVRQKLIEAGYEHREAITHDHVPLGEDDDPRLWMKFFFNQPAGQRRANIHIRAVGIAQRFERGALQVGVALLAGGVEQNFFHALF